MTTIRLRKARAEDLDALVNLEFAVFPGDRISRRSWRNLLKSPSALVTVATVGDVVAGCTVVLLNKRTAIARLYSIAVAPHARKQGVARLLLDVATLAVAEAGACLLRLETRFDNLDAQRLFIHLGFKPFKRIPGYYEDGAEAVRYQRMISDDEIHAPPESKSCHLN
ncbi:GNAT family N-acetyltransferase [Labrys okinawensis]|uniref:GNAT family N-acetyltransferase n=1 Tax=Labrys okinawensis TaxID=346911 RepID=UPI0039BC59D1